MTTEETTGLDMSREEFGRILSQAVEIVLEQYAGLGSKPVIPPPPADRIQRLFDEPIPEAGSGMDAILKQVREHVVPNSTNSVGPNFYGYVLSGGNQAGIIGELLSAALDQNAGKWKLGPAAAEIEQRVVRWVAEFIGYPADAGGVLVSGGSTANLTCLKVARDSQAAFDVSHQGLRSGPQMTMYVSAEGHSCLDKSVDELGIGREHLRKIPVKDDFTVDVAELERAILRDRESGLAPACIIGNAGTVNTGAIDPLNDLADLASRYRLWFHIDGAYGGPAAKSPLVGAFFSGLERADSVATDAHKWLYAPFEAGISFVRRGELLRKAFSLVPDYLREGDGRDLYDVSEYHFQLSRNFKALKVWMAMKAFGSGSLREAIDENIRCMNHLGRLVDEAGDFERLAPSPLSVVCFRYRTEDAGRWTDERFLDRLNREILSEVERDGRVFVSATMIHGKQALRACSVNHRTKMSHIEHLFAVLREIGRNVYAAGGDSQRTQERIDHE